MMMWITGEAEPSEEEEEKKNRPSRNDMFLQRMYHHQIEV